jgi:hypothetical protein
MWLYTITSMRWPRFLSKRVFDPPPQQHRGARVRVVDEGDTVIAKDEVPFYVVPCCV